MKLILPSFVILGVACTSPSTTAAYRPGSVVVDTDLDHVVIKLQPPPPPYPEEARAAGIQGTVIVEVIIDTNGVPTQTGAISGPSELRKYSEAYVMSWRFEPVQLHGVPQYAKFKITFPFKLRP